MSGLNLSETPARMPCTGDPGFQFHLLQHLNVNFMEMPGMCNNMENF